MTGCDCSRWSRLHKRTIADSAFLEPRPSRAVCSDAVEIAGTDTSFRETPQSGHIVRNDVHPLPIMSEFLYGVGKLVEVNRFYDVAIDAEFVCRSKILTLP
jgi:hypothetical protein